VCVRVCVCVCACVCVKATIYSLIWRGAEKAEAFTPSSPPLASFYILWKRETDVRATSGHLPQLPSEGGGVYSSGHAPLPPPKAPSFFDSVKRTRGRCRGEGSAGSVVGVTPAGGGECELDSAHHPSAVSGH